MKSQPQLQYYFMIKTHSFLQWYEIAANILRDEWMKNLTVSVDTWLVADKIIPEVFLGSMKSILLV